MRAMKLVLVPLALIALGACSKTTEKTEAPSVTGQHGVVPGQILLKTSADVNGLKELSGYKLRVLDAEEGVYLAESAQVSGKEDQAVNDLMATGKFEIVEKNHIIRAIGKIPRDPLWLQLWGLKNYGQDISYGVEGKRGADIGAMEAWEVTKGSHEVLVGIIDTGIDYNHPDLKGNIWVNEAEKNGVPGVDEDGNGYVDDIHGWNFVSGTEEAPFHGQLGSPDPMDDNGHGSHVAGTIGAVGNNGIGVAGINWNVKMMALKFLDENGSGSTADHYRALRYAAKMNIDVINASYGGGGRSDLIESALKDLADAGTVFVAAAGNSSENNDITESYPCNYETGSMISVAATDSRDQLAYFSSYGMETVDLAAPGVGVVSTYPVALTAEEAASGGSSEPYRTFSGTSMATPHVVGAVALVLAADPSLKGNPAAIKERIFESVDFLPQLAGRTATSGRLNLANAVNGVKSGNVVFSGNWTEEPYELSTPHYPTEKLDHAWVIHKEGAKAIRVHIDFAMVDTGYDVAVLYDSKFRRILDLPAELSDYWSPPILGDTVYLKFSNALVQMEDWDTGDIGAPFANFTSEGVQVDRIQFIPGEAQ